MRNATPIPGAFVASGSPLHGIDARAKVVALLALIVATVAAPPGLVVLLAVAFVVISISSGTAQVVVVREVKPALVVLVITLLANSFATDGSADLVINGSFGVTWVGVLRGACLALRIFLIVGLLLLLSATTTGPQIAWSVSTLLRPLTHIGVSVDAVALAVAMVLRFVPMAGEESRRIRMAQRTRGARFGEGSHARRLALWVGVLPYRRTALSRRRRQEALSMRERCYGSAGQGHERVPLGTAGWLTIAGSCLLAVLAFLV